VAAWVQRGLFESSLTRRLYTPDRVEDTHTVGGRLSMSFSEQGVVPWSPRQFELVGVEHGDEAAVNVEKLTHSDTNRSVAR
jgi:hypothetical protein